MISTTHRSDALIKCTCNLRPTLILPSFLSNQDNGTHESKKGSGVTVLSSSAVTKGSKIDEGSHGSDKEICGRTGSKDLNSSSSSSSSSQPLEDKTTENSIVSTAKKSSAVQSANSQEREGTACRDCLDDSLSGKETADNSLDKVCVTTVWGPSCSRAIHRHHCDDLF